MGRAASHITLECSLQTHPNITIIGEEVIFNNIIPHTQHSSFVGIDLMYSYFICLIPDIRLIYWFLVPLLTAGGFIYQLLSQLPV